MLCGLEEPTTDWTRELSGQADSMQGRTRISRNSQADHVIVRPLSTVGYTSVVASVIDSRLV